MAFSEQRRIKIEIEVSRKQADTMTDLAKAAGVSRKAYAEMLFEAGYSGRFGMSGDAGLDAAVSASQIMLLAGSQKDQIAAGLGVSVATVVRMIEAWEARNG